MSTSTLRGNTAFHETSYKDLVEANLVEFFNWGFTNAGAYTNINVSNSGAYGGDWSRLRCSTDPRYTTGTRWESIRGNWVWESGLEFGTPISISGVWVNNVLQTSGYTIDYPNGCITFSSGISSSSTVKVSHSFKEIQVINARSNPFIRQLQVDSHRPDNSDFLTNSGVHTKLADTRINLPCVSVDVVGRPRDKPFQIGGGKYVYYTAKFYVLGEDDSITGKVSDYIVNQQDKTIEVFDIDRMAQNNAFPLKYNGSLNTNPKTYPQLIQPSGSGGYRTTKFQYGTMYFLDCEAHDGQDLGPNLYFQTITATMCMIIPNI